jgi:sulfite reductase beta subunit-like hemoprotein
MTTTAAATTTPAGVCQSRPGGDRCPGVHKLHDALDGRLARVRLPGGRVPAAALTALAAAARLGNGIVEITSRANAQVRGLPDDCGGELAELLAEGGLLRSLEHDRARNILASPVAGRHPAALVEVDAVVDELDRQICAAPTLAALSGRFAFLVEDGSAVLSGRDHDVALVPVAPQGEPQFALSIDGRMSDLRAAPDAAAALAAGAARAFLEASGGLARVWRVSDLANGATTLAERLGARIGAPAATAAQDGQGAIPVPPGRLAQRDGRWAITSLAPLGRLDPRQLNRLAELAAENGSEARFSPWRTVTLVDVPATATEEVERAFDALGLVTDPQSGWRGLSACSGLGACHRATAAVRAAAAIRAAERSPDAPEEHWTACERRCGEHSTVGVAVSASGAGVEIRTARRTTVAPNVEAALAVLAAEGPPE